jgi:hypothetical protein
MAIGVKPTLLRVPHFGPYESEVIHVDDALDELAEDGKLPNVIEDKKERKDLVPF